MGVPFKHKEGCLSEPDRDKSSMKNTDKQTYIVPKGHKKRTDNTECRCRFYFSILVSN